MTEWISIKNELPSLDKNGPYSKNILICYDGAVYIGYICWDDHLFDYDGNWDAQVDFIQAMCHGWGFWDSSDGNIDKIEPSHWMPLPEIPINL